MTFPGARVDRVSVRRGRPPPVTALLRLAILLLPACAGASRPAPSVAPDPPAIALADPAFTPSNAELALLGPVERGCATDADCGRVALGRDAWCNIEGFVAAVRATDAAAVQARLDALPRVAVDDTWFSICPTALPACDAGRCALDWNWARCASSADCVRIECGPPGQERLIHVARAASAARLERDVCEAGDLVRIVPRGARCGEGLCTTD